MYITLDCTIHHNDRIQFETCLWKKNASNRMKYPDVRNDGASSPAALIRLNINAQEFQMGSTNATRTTPPRGDANRAGDNR